MDGVKSAVAVAWDSETDYIFWTDVERATINRAFWNGSNQEVIVYTNIGKNNICLLLTDIDGDKFKYLPLVWLWTGLQIKSIGPIKEHLESK